MNQTWENSKKNKLVLGPILAHLAQIWTTIDWYWLIYYDNAKYQLIN